MNYQQGDVLLREIAALPNGAKPVARRKGKIVLAEGEHTGHAHVIVAEDAELLTMDERMFLICWGEVPLTHEEHGAQVIAPSVYEINRVREYDYLTGMVNPVVD
jgi:hypothetical protein